MRNVWLTKIGQKMLYTAYFGLVTVVFGCSASSPSYQQAQNPEQIAYQSTHSETAPAVPDSEPSRQDNSLSLEQLWQNRAAENLAVSSSAQSFMLGPGDLLRISVPSIDELKNRTVRVSEHDTVALPLLGTINVSGMTEDDLRSELIHRLKKYMYQPQVEVFLEHTENREVAVLGAVTKPGRYMLSSHEDTIMTMISRAGGFTGMAASRLIFVPAQANSSRTVDGSRSGLRTTPDPPTGELSQPSLTRTSEPGEITNGPEQGQFLISLSNLQDQHYLDIPVKPGDVIVVPDAGQVTVQGWVSKPGAFPITPGLTVLGSIAAAGGTMFTSSATLLREAKDGGKVSIPLDLSKIKSGEQPDLHVQGGDVLIAERSAVGAVPYTMYFLLNRVGIGAGLYY